VLNLAPTSTCFIRQTTRQGDNLSSTFCREIEQSSGGSDRFSSESRHAIHL